MSQRPLSLKERMAGLNLNQVATGGGPAPPATGGGKPTLLRTGSS
jgi:hypothetical protein